MSKFTKQPRFSAKHYDAVAEMLGNALIPLSTQSQVDGWASAMASLRAGFKADSPRFDPARFTEACHTKGRADLITAYRFRGIQL